MSIRIIRSSEKQTKSRSTAGGIDTATVGMVTADEVTQVEKQAFDRGYTEGERIGKQLGESLLETAIKRYDETVRNLAGVHRTLTDAMETETVRLALEIARKIIHREATIDPDLAGALVSVALKRAHGHHGIEARVSSHDYERVCETFRNANSSMSVKEDAALERGDFILDTVETHFDGRIASQIDAVEKAFFDE